MAVAAFGPPPGAAMAAVADALAAIALGGLAWWCWHRGVIVTVQDGVPLSRIDGMWWAVATGVATLAGITLLDALRQGVLAVSRPGLQEASASDTSTRGAPQAHM